MPNADDDELRARLTEALDRVQPPFSTPRYLAARPRSLAWRLAPAMLAATALSALVVSAYAGTGSPNPIVWTEKVVNVVQPPAPPPAPERTQKPGRQAPSPEPSDRESPEPAQSPEPSESPQPSDAHEDSSSPGTSTTSPSDSGDAERS